MAATARCPSIGTANERRIGEVLKSGELTSRDLPREVGRTSKARRNHPCRRGRWGCATTHNLGLVGLILTIGKIGSTLAPKSGVCREAPTQTP